jgi:hypothetical protein
VRLLTRHGYDWSDRYPRIIEAARWLRKQSDSYRKSALFTLLLLLITGSFAMLRPFGRITLDRARR